ncbi:MAG: tyrosine-type recombinase/integrase [Rectinemataceae bacterium]
MKRFYLHERDGIFYAEIVNPETQRKSPAKSTGARTKDDATLVVAEWLRSGIPTGRGGGARDAAAVFSIESTLAAIRGADLTAADATKIVDTLKARGLLLSAVVAGGPGSELTAAFFKRFWDYEKSPYVREKLAHGQTISKGHCKHSLARISTHWLPVFGARRLGELTRADLKAFATSLGSPEKALAAATRNRVLVAGTTALRWAFENDLIPADPTVGVATFTGTALARGILDPDEACALFALPWRDDRARLASLIAATTGLRSGEIRALALADVGEVVLEVRHAWSGTDGLKTPKNGEGRRVPLLPSLRDELRTLAAASPHGPGGFIFYGPSKDAPMGESVLLDGLRGALEALGVDWQARNINFHSWRHFYASRMSDHIDSRKLMRATGHKTASVFEAYAAHGLSSDLVEVGNAAAVVFANLERKAKGSPAKRKLG